nr:immunoglobulin heavy chain junction region [Mus musculus]
CASMITYYFDYW